ncbi:hypothetical protein B0J14DRAFT_610547 [Halenospora varia]|nr:hypothetical protein B0J14DRAFT_610547 [Halenospora varia]
MRLRLPRSLFLYVLVRSAHFLSLLFNVEMLRNRTYTFSKHNVVFLTVLYCLVSQTFAKSCYYPDGKKTPADARCTSSGGESACCGPGFVCLSNGLCMDNSTANNVNNPNVYYRGSCTDKTWQSPSCPSFCVDLDPKAIHAGNTTGGQAMGKCFNATTDSYYCRNSGASLGDCQNPQRVITFPGVPTAITTLPLTPIPTESHTRTKTSQTGLPTMNNNIITSNSQRDLVVTTLTSTSTSTPTSFPTITSLSTIDLNPNPTDSTGGTPRILAPQPTTAEAAAPAAEPSQSYATRHAIPIAAGVGGSVAVTFLILLVVFICYRRKHNIEVEEIYKGPSPIAHPNHSHSSVNPNISPLPLAALSIPTINLPRPPRPDVDRMGSPIDYRLRDRLPPGVGGMNGVVAGERRLDDVRRRERERVEEAERERERSMIGRAVSAREAGGWV